MNVRELFKRSEAVLEYRPVKRSDGGWDWYWVLLPLPEEDTALAAGMKSTRGAASLEARTEARKVGKRISKVRTHHHRLSESQRGYYNALTEAFDQPYSPKWKPAPGMLEWFRRFLSLMNDKSTWEVPGTGQVYKIDHKAKTFTLVGGPLHEPLKWHEKNKVTLGMLGYTVLDKPEPPVNPNEHSLAEGEEDTEFDAREYLLMSKPTTVRDCLRDYRFDRDINLERREKWHRWLSDSVSAGYDKGYIEINRTDDSWFMAWYPGTAFRGNEGRAHYYGEADVVAALNRIMQDAKLTESEEEEFDARDYLLADKVKQPDPVFLFTFGDDDGEVAAGEHLAVPWEVLAPFGIKDYQDLSLAWRPPDEMLENAVIDYAQATIEQPVADWDFLVAVDFFIAEQDRNESRLAENEEEEFDAREDLLANNSAEFIFNDYITAWGPLLEPLGFVYADTRMFHFPRWKRWQKKTRVGEWSVSQSKKRGFVHVIADIKVADYQRMRRLKSAQHRVKKDISIGYVLSYLKKKGALTDDIANSYLGPEEEQEVVGADNPYGNNAIGAEGIAGQYDHTYLEPDERGPQQTEHDPEYDDNPDYFRDTDAERYPDQDESVAAGIVNRLIENEEEEFDAREDLLQNAPVNTKRDLALRAIEAEYGTLDPDIVGLEAASKRSGSVHAESIHGPRTFCGYCGWVDRDDRRRRVNVPANTLEPDPVHHPEYYLDGDWPAD